MSDATDNRFYREKQPAVSESLIGRLEELRRQLCIDGFHNQGNLILEAIAAMDMHKKPDNLNTSGEHAQSLELSSTLNDVMPEQVTLFRESTISNVQEGSNA